MLKTIESWLADYPNLIAALSSLGTLAAVIVALWLAHKERFSKVTSRIFMGRYIPAGSRGTRIELDKCEQIISVSITNHGPHTIYLSYLSSFIWKIPFSRRIATMNPSEPDFYGKDLEILPGKSAGICFKEPDKAILNMRQAIPLKIFPTLRFKFMQFYISTTSGQLIQAKVDYSLRNFITKVIT